MHDQIVHEVNESNRTNFTTSAWSWCGGYFHDDQIHIKLRVVTCLWCIARTDGRLT